MVRETIQETILEALEENPDCFADSETHPLPRWVPGGEVEKRIRKWWGRNEVGTLWANPPFTVLAKVVGKGVREDQARMISVRVVGCWVTESSSSRSANHLYLRDEGIVFARVYNFRLASAFTISIRHHECSIFIPAPSRAIISKRGTQVPKLAQGTRA